MNKPLVSVVIETITARYDAVGAALLDELARPLGGLTRQTWPWEKIEAIVVLDEAFDPEVAAEIRRRYPWVKFATSTASNYFAAKNAGAAIATGDVIALLDGDCEPSPDWLEILISRLTPDVGAVAGRTRYEGGSLLARTLSVPDFGHVIAKDDGASGFNINNVAFRREVFLSHPFEERLARNGGCVFLFHQLRADGIRVVYENRATVAHGLDIQDFGFVQKHFDRGRDGVSVYRFDARGVMRGTRFFRLAGPFALVALCGRRIVMDWIRMTRHRAEIGIRTLTLPYFWGVTVVTRLIELAGALSAVPARRR